MENTVARFTYHYDLDCPSCKGSQVVKSGMRNDYQRYKCQSCGKKFSKIIRIETPAKGRKYGDEVVGAALWQYFMGGMSIRNIARNIAFREGLSTPSTDTIFQWAKDYCEAATYALRDAKAHTGDEWVADEMVIDVDGRNVYHWNVLDRETRVLLATHVSEGRGEEDAVQVFRKALAKAGRPPKRVITDKWVAYPPALRELMPNSKHVKSRGISHWINNNLSERMQGTYRQRIKTMRGMGDLTSAQQFLDGFTISYNHFRDHSALKGQTPGEVAKMEIPFKEWADVVRADIEVPEEWKRKPRMRTQRVKEYAGHTKKGYRKRPRKRKREGTPGVQLGIWRHKNPTKRDKERVEAHAKAKAPQPVMPDMSRKPQAPAYDTQPRLMSKPRLTIPQRMLRPTPAGHRRRH